MPDNEADAPLSEAEVRKPKSPRGEMRGLLHEEVVEVLVTCSVGVEVCAMSSFNVGGLVEVFFHSLICLLVDFAEGVTTS